MDWDQMTGTELKGLGGRRPQQTSSENQTETPLRRGSSSAGDPPDMEQAEEEEAEKSE